jgi:signal transduction histidine kinase
MSELLTPPVITGLVAVLLLVPPAVIALWRQHGHWRKAERSASQARYTRTALQAALETAPEGYFAWFHQPAPEEDEEPTPFPAFREGGYCSRRLAVLLDLFRGFDANFEEVVEGFDADSRDRLQNAIARLRDGGDGFQIDLTHVGSGRRIQARGVRATDDQGRTMADVVWMSDVTEGVAAVDTLTQETAALRRERNLLKAALDGIAEPVWLRDDDLSLIYCNTAYVKAVDAKNAGDVVARGRELAPRVAVREARALAAAARASAETRRAPFHMVIEGSRRLMEVTESPVEAVPTAASDESQTTAPLFSDGSGRLTAGFAYDITRQEELETRVKREAAAHADVLERLTTAIAIFGPDTRLVFFNTAFSRLWRLDPSWLLDGPNYGTLLDTLRGERKLPEVADFPAYKEKELARFNSLIEPLEDVLHVPDGGTLRRVIAPHPMGGLLTTYEDVTDKLALERSYNTLIAVQRETIDNLQEAVAVFGADGQLRLANPAFAELWDLSLEALREGPAMGVVIEAFRDFFEDAAIWTRHRAVMLQALSADRERAAQQGRVVRSDGSVLEFISVPLPDGGVLFCYNDVSAPERVAQALRGRAEALTATDKLRSEFITNVAAELEGPVSSIASLATRMVTKNGVSALAPGAAQDIIGAARVLKTLIEDVRDLSGVEAGQQTLHLDSFDIREVVERVVSMTREAVKRRGVTLLVDCPPETGWMIGDDARIKQTLYHIISGALKNAGGGRVDLAVKRGAPAEVTFTVRHAAAQGHMPGLGVYVAQRMVELHGGRLEITTDGADTVIACRLPAGGAAGRQRGHTETVTAGQ